MEVLSGDILLVILVLNKYALRKSKPKLLLPQKRNATEVRVIERDNIILE